MYFITAAIYHICSVLGEHKIFTTALRQRLAPLLFTALVNSAMLTPKLGSQHFLTSTTAAQLFELFFTLPYLLVLVCGFYAIFMNKLKNTCYSLYLYMLGLIVCALGFMCIVTYYIYEYALAELNAKRAGFASNIAFYIGVITHSSGVAVSVRTQHMRCFCVCLTFIFCWLC